ncbi:MAG: tetratricopeptide repeat protein [Candidatus Omnitrophica bacterium]|nr:tetratricopeptide repeat protein [Candidatus Omnitrophota bacterium]
MDDLINNGSLSKEAKHLALGNSYLDNKNYALALKEFNKGLEINSNNEYIHSALGHVYLQQKQFDLALQAFNKAIEINTKVESAHQGLGTIYLERESYNLAEKEFEITLRFNDDNIFVHQMLGYVYKRNGKHDLAVAEFIKATNLYLSKEDFDRKLVDFKKNNNIISANNKKIMTKILRMPSFCNKGMIHSTELNTSLLPPLALGQIVAHLRTNGIEIDQDDLNIKIHYDNYYSKIKGKEIDRSIFFDEHRISKYISGDEDKDLELIMESIERKTNFYDYSIILLSLPIIFENSSGLLFTLVLSRFLKKKYNPILILGGGNQSIDLLTRHICKDIDFIIHGDGEVLLLELLLALKKNANPAEFAASHIRENGKIIADKIYPPIKPDFSGLPIDMYKYVGLSSMRNSNSNEILEEFNKSRTLLLPFKFIRGCPYECTFCPESTNKSIYVLEPKRAALYLKELQNEYNPAGFFFLSDTINISRQYINELCDEIIKSNIKVFWTDSARADNLDKGTILKMREAGCIRLIFGMETASSKLLRYIDKRIGLSNLENILKWADEAGIWTGLEIICGLPYEEDADIEETISFLNKNKKHINSLYFNQFGLRDGSILLQKAEKFRIENIVELNQYANEEFTYFHKYGYDESSGLMWQDKKTQILTSHRKLLNSISWNIDFPIYEFEHFLFFLYNKFSDKRLVCDIFAKAEAENNKE